MVGFALQRALKSARKYQRIPTPILVHVLCVLAASRRGKKRIVLVVIMVVTGKPEKKEGYSAAAGGGCDSGGGGGGSSSGRRGAGDPSPLSPLLMRTKGPKDSQERCWHCRGVPENDDSVRADKPFRVIQE
ncbi:hypothetical protein V1478_001103 [Vespula squamosa]|uniref:Uncharacterized protein n=1 Tax=Vespula squamosa TaxID=30214 RepID=A0ABD2C7D6_VESSQ